MSKSKLDEALERFPEIAKVVNQFSSPDVQVQAFKILTGILSGSLEIAAASEARHATPSTPPSTGISGGPKPKRRSGATAQPKLVNDLDLKPKGKTSLKDFFAEKGPSSDPEVYACMVFYLKNILQIDTVGMDHLFTCFKDLGRKVPNIKQGLKNTQRRKGYLNTADFSNINLTRNGENFVEHDLKPKVKSANA
ncbi:MAG: hypothetical protein NBV67_18430 [Tagaea sp.]|nr:hypothetical protein [Tagaea sp.]